MHGYSSATVYNNETSPPNEQQNSREITMDTSKLTGDMTASAVVSDSHVACLSSQDTHSLFNYSSSSSAIVIIMIIIIADTLPQYVTDARLFVNVSLAYVCHQERTQGTNHTQLKAKPAADACEQRIIVTTMTCQVNVFTMPGHVVFLSTHLLAYIRQSG